MSKVPKGTVFTDMLGQGYDGRPELGFPSEQDALVIVLRWEYRDYAEWCARGLDLQRFTEMAFYGNNFLVNNQIRRACDIAVGVFVCGWKALGKTCAKSFLRFKSVDLSFVLYNHKVEYVHRMSD